MTIVPLPDAGIIEGPNKVCVGGNITLTDTVAGGTWGGTNLHSTLSGSVVTGISPGMDTITYTVTGTYCAATVIKTVRVTPLPEPGTITGASPVCVGATVTLNETVSGGRWVDDNTTVATIDTLTGMVTALSTGTTTIRYTVIDTNGCTDSTTFTFTVTPPQFSIDGTTTNELCYDGTNGKIELRISGTPPFEYEWSNGKTDEVIDGLPAGTYSVSVTQPATHCKLTHTFEIVQPDSITISLDLVPDTCKLGRGSIIAVATGGTSPYTYSWSDSAGSKGITATINELRSGAYTLTVTDANSCIDTLNTVLTEEPCNNVVIHDVITPNGDGANDKWVIEGIHLYPNNIVQIFDKWGDKVYEKRSYENDWYGQNKNNTLLPDGTYYYIVKLSEENKTGGETEFTGTVLVKR
jgi:gliding motility-associated-like protein